MSVYSLLSQNIFGKLRQEFKWGLLDFKWGAYVSIWCNDKLRYSSVDEIGTITVL